MVYIDGLGLPNVAARVARRYGLIPRKYHHKWPGFGRSKQFIRNHRVIEAEHPSEDGTYITHVAAFVTRLFQSEYAIDMVRKAARHKIRNIVLFTKHRDDIHEAIPGVEIVFLGRGSSNTSGLR